MGRIARLAVLLPPLAWACRAEPTVEWPAPLEATATVQYPVELWDQGIEGVSTLLVLVNAVGGVDSVRVSASSGHAAFDSAAIAAVRRLRFRPGRKDDERVEMWVRLPVRFTKTGGAELGAAQEAER